MLTCQPLILAVTTVANGIAVLPNARPITCNPKSPLVAEDGGLYPLKGLTRMPLTLKAIP